MSKAIKVILWGFGVANGVMLMILLWGLRLGEVCASEPNKTILIIEATFCLLSTCFVGYMAYKDIKAMAMEKKG